MQREKIEFPTNTPVVLKLEWDEGTLKPGRFGDEYMYVCDNDARIMWVKPELHVLIGQSGARAGDEIAITKREVKDGSRRRTQWEVEKVEEEPRQAQPAKPTPRAQQPAPANPPVRPDGRRSFAAPQLESLQPQTLRPTGGSARPL